MREMKDSGIEWIGDIPKSWKTIQIKNLFIILSGATPTPDTDNWDGDVLWITPADYKTKDKYVSEGKRNISQQGFNTCSTSIIPKGSIIFSKRAPIGTVAINTKALCTNQGCLSCISKSDTCNDYFYYVMSIGTEHFELLGSGTTFKEISANSFSNCKLPCPDKGEQERIAGFLDRKCAEIDSLVSDIQRQIELLEEYKRSVITEAVTKGLDKNAPMKDSGIEWIGDIPEHWGIMRGKYIFVQRNERGNIIQLQLLSPTQKYGVIPQDLYEEISGYKAVKLDEKADLSLLKTIHKGDFCISLRSFQGGFEYSEYEGVVSPAYQVFYPIIEVFNGYYKHLFKTKIFIDKMNSFTMSMRDGKNIAFADFESTYLPVPSLQEQQAIAGYLDEKCDEIDSIISEKKQQLEAIEEYKKSLIFEYVTGKREVLQ